MCVAAWQRATGLQVAAGIRKHICDSRYIARGACAFATILAMHIPLTIVHPLGRFLCYRLAVTLASQMLMVSLSWKIYDATGSAFDLGLVGLFQLLPSLVLVLAVGHVADHFDRQRILILCLAAQVFTVGGLAAAEAAGYPMRDAILLASAMLGLAKAFQLPCQLALLPSLVSPGGLARAVAANASCTQTGIVLGPVLGGAVYGVDTGMPYPACAVLLVVSWHFILSIRSRQASDERRRAGLKTLVAGFAFVRDHKVILGAISIDLLAVLLGGETALLPVYARDILGTGPAGLGLLRAAPAVGALAMSLYLARCPNWQWSGNLLLRAVMLYGIATLVFGASSSLVVSLLALAATGAFDMMSIVIRQSLIQHFTPDAMRGRVGAVNGLCINASNQLGEFESGLSAHWIGARYSVMFGAIGALVIVSAWKRLFPELADAELGCRSREPST